MLTLILKPIYCNPENVDLEEGELTKPGFIALNEMEAEDADDDIDDLWVTLSSMGFNKELFIDEVRKLSNNHTSTLREFGVSSGLDCSTFVFEINISWLNGN